MSKTSAEPSLDQMAVAIVEALEPKPPKRPHYEYGRSPHGLWEWDSPITGWQPIPWDKKDLGCFSLIASVEALLRQDPARWDRYGHALMDQMPRALPINQGAQYANLATAPVEQRLRAAYRAVRGE